MADAWGVPSFAFQFIASDGFQDSAPGQVTVNVARPEIVVASSAVVSQNSFQMGFTSTPGLVFSVWASTNLTTWARVGAATENSPGNFQFNEPAVTNSARFYQLRWP